MLVKQGSRKRPRGRAGRSRARYVAAPQRLVFWVGRGWCSLPLGAVTVMETVSDDDDMKYM